VSRDFGEVAAMCISRGDDESYLLSRRLARSLVIEWHIFLFVARHWQR
jgi:hypothetical protein